MVAQPTPMVSISWAAKRLNVSPRTVRRLIAEGKLEAFRVGERSIRLDPHDVEKQLEPIPAGDSAAS